MTCYPFVDVFDLTCRRAGAAPLTFGCSCCVTYSVDRACCQALLNPNPKHSTAAAAAPAQSMPAQLAATLAEEASRSTPLTVCHNRSQQQPGCCSLQEWLALIGFGGGSGGSSSSSLAAAWVTPLAVWSLATVTSCDKCVFSTTLPRVPTLCLAWQL